MLRKLPIFERPLIPLLIALILGILCRTLWLSDSPVLSGLCLGLIILMAIALFFIPPSLLGPLLLILFFVLGTWLAMDKEPDSVLRPLAAARSRVVLEGTVLEPPRLFSEKARVFVQVEKRIDPSGTQIVHEKIQITVYNHTTECSPGDRIRFPARLSPFRNFNNPGQYDYVRAMDLKGLVCSAAISDGRSIVPMGKGNLGFPLHILEKIRKPIRDFFKQNLEPQDQALLRALILGEQQEIDPETREHFNKTGLGHILAVSGFNIALVAGLVFFPLKWLLTRFYGLTLALDIRKTAAVLTAFPVILYTGLSGLEYSSQRAMIMVLAYLFSIVIGREKDLWSTLALAALVILAINPAAIFSISFQLSFTAVIGLIWLTPVIFNKMPAFPPADSGYKKIIKYLYQSTVGALAVTLGATLLVLPLTAYYFYRTSLVVVPANLTVLPFFSFWIIPLGLLAALLLPLAPGLAHWVLQVTDWGLQAAMAVIRFWADFEYSAIWTIRPNVLEIVLFYALLFFIFFFKRRTWCRIGLGMVLLIAGADAGYWLYQTRFDRSLRVTYFDVGQGNAALIQFPGRERMLIDGGGFPQDDFDVGRMVLAPALFSSKIGKIDYLVLTHPEADHMNGLRFIAAHFKPKEFWWNGAPGKGLSYRELLRILDDRKIQKLAPRDLQAEREIAGVKTRVLHPLGEPPSDTDPGPVLSSNDQSLVLRLEYGGQSFLFPGDLEKKGEEIVTARFGEKLQSTILLACHHGSISSNSEFFLSAVKPKWCIVSAGSRNAFGFPNAGVLQRLRQLGCQTLRIDQVGAVRVNVAPGHLQIKTFLDKTRASPDPDRVIDQPE
ncbi:MAG: DNA internalization-related competence protein ComEC/Rec2 [Desulfobacteraceae bacterium]|nr:MAG: DNA internalization-related competence protein ComEC/Rec2 [Desulfobacteraceae bacterium]